MKSNGRIVELNSAPYPDGRRRVVVALHEIYPDETRWNENGITWLEPYVSNCAPSVEMMPLCVRYWDEENGVPFNHGFSHVEGKMPVFEDSYVVGVCDSYEIRELDGCKMLCGIGVIYQQRYPRFVTWLEEAMAQGQEVYSSIEIVAAKGNEEVIYRDGWKEQGRIPTQYTYSGHAFLTVPPADAQSKVIEFSENQNKEEQNMDKEQMEQLTQAIVAGVKTVLSENSQQEQTQEEFEAKLAQKDERIAELEAEVEALKADLGAKEENATEVKEELNECKKTLRTAELNAMLSGFDEEKQNFAKEEIEAFKADPIGCTHSVDAIKTKIEACAFRALEDQRKQYEENAKKNHAPDIFGYTPLGNEDSGKIVNPFGE